MAADKVDDVADSGKVLKTADRFGNAANAVESTGGIFDLPDNPSDLINNGWREITHKGMQTNTTSRMFEKDGMKIVFDEAMPNAKGFRGKNHYHVFNPNATGKHDYYLNKAGNPVPKNSKQSHILTQRRNS